MIYLTLFLEFFKIGLFTFGGGYAMITLIWQTVEKYGWMDSTLFYDFIGISESTPGPFAINIATFVGTSQGGVLGAIAATLGVVLPSFIVILIIAKLFMHFEEKFLVKSAFIGLRPCVVGIIAAAAVDVALKTIFQNVKLESFVEFFKSLDYKAIIIGVVTIAIIKIFKKLPPAGIIGVSAVLGIVCYGLF